MSMTIDEIRDCLQVIQEEVLANKDWLTDLDAAIGDGDLGITMSRGFTAVAEESQRFESKDIGKFLIKAGMTFNKVSPSTLGTLISSAFLRAGRSLSGKTRLENKDVVYALQAALEGIRERGKSSRGDKTIIDALEPAVERLDTELKNGRSLTEAWQLAVGSAQEGFDHTAQIASKVGRAGWFGEHSIGKHDPGAGLGLVVWRAIGKYLTDLDKGGSKRGHLRATDEATMPAAAQRVGRSPGTRE